MRFNHVDSTSITINPSFHFSGTARPSLRCSSSSSPDAPEAPVAWDPEGILTLSTPAQGGHFARRARERAASVSSTTASPSSHRPPPPGPQIRPLPGPPCPQGILATEKTQYDKKALAAALAEKYMPVDLSFPGLRIHHLDPPVFSVDAFFTPEECAQMREAALSTGRMVESKVGAGNANSDDRGGAAASLRRTSTSVLVDDALLAAHPALVASTADLQARGKRLLGGGTEQGKAWGPAGKLPSPLQYCYEGLQVTQYHAGQYFMEHEDGFPLPLARQNGFNRHATLLVYLNEVADGGATRFEYLDLSVSPAEGRALLFFPCFSDGSPDGRTLHTATTAVDWKIVTQQWVARGFSAAEMITRQLTKKKQEEKEDDKVETLLMGGGRRKSGGGSKGGKGGKTKKTSGGGGFGAASLKT